MTPQTKESLPQSHAFLSKRRIVLLASVAAIGGAVILAGPGYRPVTLGGTAAHAVETNAVQHQAGFADLIDRVKPAVISVRVKIEQQNDETVGQGGMQQQQFSGNDEDLQKFFRQFGMPDGRQLDGRARASSSSPASARASSSRRTAMP